MNELMVWSNARRAIEEARSIDEIKDIRDKAEALRLYAKQAGETLEVQNNVAEIKIRAERKAGELLREMKDRGERDAGQGGDRKSPLQAATVIEPPPTLSELGIERTQAHRWQRMADIPEEAFEEQIAETKAKNEELTSAGIQRFARQRTQQERRAELRVVTLEEALTNRTFTVITADPPWQYSNSGFSTSAEAHYPTMPTDAIAAMPVADYAASNAVLFLWATNPLLPDALEVMRAWGFEYKTNMVWVKDRHVAGFYCYGQHELLLIGVKGSAIPDYVPASLIQAPVSRHSAKPESVYELIERMYPHGPYLELFARAEREGWATFGNEVPCGE